MKNNFVKQNGGFTLTEVIIGIMILTVAIVTATGILTNIISTNKNNLNTLKAYYLAQEGIEAVVNIRDTNWLNNLNWLGDESGNPWGRPFVVGSDYSVDVVRDLPNYYGGDISFDQLSVYAPWRVLDADESKDFNRVISILPYEDEHVLVRSTVFFGNDKKIFLEKMLTNWKTQ